jgi:hypothetical protein
MLGSKFILKNRLLTMSTRFDRDSEGVGGFVLHPR